MLWVPTTGNEVTNVAWPLLFNFPGPNRTLPAAVVS